MSPPDPAPPMLARLDFADASQEVLRFLHSRLGLGLWMVTRVHGDDWIVLSALDTAEYDIEPGLLLRWSDTFCSRMVEGMGPRVAADSDAVEVFREAPVRSMFPIRSYVGVPIRDRNGALFGTLCGIDPEPQPDSIENELPLVELLSELLSAILSLEMERDSAHRRVELAEMRARSDELTGVLNRTGWAEALEHEQARCRRYGHRAAVLVADLDGLKQANDANGHAHGDRLLTSLAEALLSVSRETDTVARLGGDEFAMLAVETEPGAAAELEARVRAALAARAMEASSGAVDADPSGDLISAARLADDAMYEDKRSRRSP